MVNKTFFLILVGFILFGCNNDKSKEKALLAEVIKVHDKVMADDEVIMKDKMQLNAIAIKTPGTKDSADRYVKLLGDADDTMMNWMNKFNPDFTGKPHEAVMGYLTMQKAEIAKINVRLDSVIAASNNYITKNKTK
jgi:dsDNA-binding SOS-regulon protein